MGTIIPLETFTCADWCMLSWIVMRIDIRSSMNSVIAHRPDCVPRREAIGDMGMDHGRLDVAIACYPIYRVSALWAPLQTPA
jgi:hypothetical protein